MSERDQGPMETGEVHLPEPGIEPPRSFLRYLPKPGLFLPILVVATVVHGGLTSARPHYLSDLYEMIASLVAGK